MADPFVGEIRPYAFAYAPQGWLLCNGQIVEISDYELLFAVIYNIFGGDGRNTFAVPNLKGNVPIGAGYAPGLYPWHLGQQGGLAGVPLTRDQIPAHDHTAGADFEYGTAPDPGGLILAATTADNPEIYKDGAQDQSLVAMASQTLSTIGQGQPHENRQPYQVLNFCICYDGIFPPRP